MPEVGRSPLNGKVPTGKGWPKREPRTLAEAEAWALAGNIGVRCGPASGRLIVIDIDSLKGGTLDGLPPLPPTVTVLTGGGGQHRYFRLPPGVSIGNSAGKLAPHVDVRGEGGQVRRRWICTSRDGCGL